MTAPRADFALVADPVSEPATDLVTRAERAVRLSGTAPGRADEEAHAVLAEARRARHDEAASVALRASALAARELGDLALAEERLHQAISVGAGFPRRVAQAKMSLVAVRALLGDPRAALRLADLAEADLRGTDLARLGVQRSVALMLLGRHRDAVRHCDGALDALAGDPKFHAGGLLNRGLAFAYLEDYENAARDLLACARVARATGLDHVAMLAEGNLPFLAARRGDIAGAFESYQAAEAALLGYPDRLAAMRVDFAEALISARLLGDARAVLERALPDLVASGARAALAEARLLLAHVNLLTGDARQAYASAETARSELIAQGRESAAPLAAEVMLRARLSDAWRGDQSLGGEHLAAALMSCALGLSENGWAAASDALRLLAAETAQRLGDHVTVRRQLDMVTTPDARTEPGIRTVIRQHAHAMRLHLAGDVHGALNAAWAGLTVAQPDRANHPEGECTADPVGLKQTDLDLVDGTDNARADREFEPESTPDCEPDAGPSRAAATLSVNGSLSRVLAARQTEALARFGLALALETGAPWTVLAWAEVSRALVRGDRPAGDSTSADAPLPPEGPLWGSEVAPVASPSPARALPPPSFDGVLLEFLRNGDDLAVVVITCSAAEVRRLGSYTATAEATVRIRYALRRRNLRDACVTQDLERELGTLDEQLLGTASLPHGRVVIVPTGALLTLPWSLLPSLRGRPVAVSTAATSWPAAYSNSAPEARPDGTRHAAIHASSGASEALHRPRVAALAGPGLEHGEAEADMVVKSHANAIRIGATKQTVLTALEHADVVHIAAHGMFSACSPMLSRITLDDEPLMAYDLLRPRRVPGLVILSACDAGIAHAPVDGAALGLTGAFLDLGVTSVVASVLPVRDDEALTLMTAFHALLAADHGPIEALATATHTTGVDGFVCFTGPPISTTVVPENPHSALIRP